MTKKEKIEMLLQEEAFDREKKGTDITTDGMVAKLQTEPYIASEEKVLSVSPMTKSGTTEAGNV